MNKTAKGEFSQIRAVETDHAAEENDIRLFAGNLSGSIVFTPGDQGKFTITPFDTTAKR